MSNRRDVGSPVLLRLESEPAHVIRLDRPLTIVGSKLHSHVRIVSQSISGSHALLLNLGNQVFLRDLMSRTHLSVNDREVTEAQLKYGDVLRFGEMRFRYVDADVIRQSLAGVRSGPAELHFQGRDSVPVDKPLFVFGRHEGADVVLQSSRVSKAHAVLYMQGGGWMLRDLGSREGTLVNGAPIRTIALRGGDSVRIGRTSFTFIATPSSQDGGAGEATARAISAAGEVTDVGEAETEHVFVAEPEVVSSRTLSDAQAAPAGSDPVSEFLAQPMGNLAGKLDLSDAASLASEPSTAWEFDPGAAEPVDDNASDTHPMLGGDADAQVDNAHDLVDWGVVAGSPIVPAPEPFPEHHETPAADVPAAPVSNLTADLHALSMAACSATSLPVAPPEPAEVRQNERTPATIDRAAPALSEPVDLDAAKPSAALVPAAPGRDLPATAADAPDPLAEILGDQILTLYSAQPQSLTEVPYASDGGARRRSRPAWVMKLGAMLLALVAAASGAWLYLHRS